MRLFRMNFGQTRPRLVQAGAALAAAVLVAGCGNNYRPTLTPIGSSGPPAQPSSFAVVVSAPSVAAPGIVTIVDYSGDSVMAEAPIGSGPTAFSMNPSGGFAFTLNSDGTVSNFFASTTLQAKNVVYTTLPSTAEPVNLFSSATGLWAADLCASDPPAIPCNPLIHSGADVFSGNPQTFLRSIPLAPTPVMVAGLGSASQRYFGISQGNSQGGNVASGVACNISPSTVGVNGEADGIEVSSDTVSSQIPLGQCPVYAVESSDGRRLFVLNRGSDTITVIDTEKNTLDSCSGLVNQNGQPIVCHPSLPVSPAPGLTHAGPVYAEYNAATSQLVVANYDGNSISVIDVSLDEFGNDSSTFGTTFTIPVGGNPASVTVLNDGSRAYAANQTGQSVTVVNLSSHTVEKTIPVTGYPRSIVSTQNSIDGKVYVASPNSNALTIINTTQDIVVQLTGSIQGNIVDVRVTTQNGSSGTNANNESRVPGYGQPCNLPDLPGGYQVVGAPPGTTVEPSSKLTDCQAQDAALLQ
jgi:YVTN family beta-propeller protein